MLSVVCTRKINVNNDTLFRSNKEHPLDIKGEVILQELPACGGEVGIRGEAPGLDLGDEDLVAALDEQIGAKVDGDGLIVDIEDPASADLALQDGEAIGLKHALGFGFSAYRLMIPPNGRTMPTATGSLQPGR